MATVDEFGRIDDATACSGCCGCGSNVAAGLGGLPPEGTAAGMEPIIIGGAGVAGWPGCCSYPELGGRGDSCDADCCGWACCCGASSEACAPDAPGAPRPRLKAPSAAPLRLEASGRKSASAESSRKAQTS